MDSLLSLSLCLSHACDHHHTLALPPRSFSNSFSMTLYLICSNSFTYHYLPLASTSYYLKFDDSIPLSFTNNDKYLPVKYNRYCYLETPILKYNGSSQVLIPSDPNFLGNFLRLSFSETTTAHDEKLQKRLSTQSI